VQLDGKGHRRLTHRPLHHGAFRFSPDGKWFVATYEAVNVPPQTGLFHTRGGQVAVLAAADVHEAREAGLCFGEPFSFLAEDDETHIYGIIHKPTDFTTSQEYPLLIRVYGGPASRGITNRFAPADPYCEFGFVIATIANRGTTGRGKAFETATYLKLGGPDLQDQVDGTKILCQRPYVDAARVGIFGHSYGGYMTALAMLKHPDVFHVGVAGAPVTDWRNYDTIYTERYMWLPSENAAGYRDSSCLTYAKNLKGKLLLLHGLIDDNVHPANTWQLVDFLQREQMRFDMLIYPRSKHSLGTDSQWIRWEYLQRHLVGADPHK
jgi:dipeptidyl-peptidase-4